MLVAREPEEQGGLEEHDNDNDAAQGADTVVSGDDVQDQSIPSPTPPTSPPQPPQNIPSTSQVAGDEQVKGRQAKIYQIDMDHASKVLSMQEVEPEVQEVVEVVTTAKLIIEVVAAVSESISAASATIADFPAATINAASSKDKGKGIMVEEQKPIKKKQQVEMVEEYARKFHKELKKDIDWDVAIDHNVAGFRLDYFKGMSYDDIRPIFEAKFNLNIEFLLKLKVQIEEEENISLEKATPLARKVPIVDYHIIQLNNKSRYKIIRADGTHRLYVSFITLLKNFDREDLESLWSIVKERFYTSKPNNYSDDYLLTTLRVIFGRPDGQDQVWKNQRSVHGQAKEIENEFLEGVEKLEWWFEQDIDDEGEDEEDGCGDEI
nr:hypothetical protein [Tanacetum cinerariifolium]